MGFRLASLSLAHGGIPFPLFRLGNSCSSHKTQLKGISSVNLSLPYRGKSAYDVLWAASLFCLYFIHLIVTRPHFEPECVCFEVRDGTLFIYLCVSDMEHTVGNIFVEIIIERVNEWGNRGLGKLSGSSKAGTESRNWVSSHPAWPLAGPGCDRPVRWMVTEEWLCLPFYNMGNWGLRRVSGSAVLGRGKQMNIFECLPAGSLRVTCFGDFISPTPHNNATQICFVEKELWMDLSILPVDPY